MPIGPGALVTLHYVLRVDGEVEATSRNGAPLTVVQGGEALVPGLEAALLGRAAGDRFVVEVPPEQGYGRRLFFGPQRVERSMLPAGAHIVPGMRVRMKQKDGTPAEFWVTGVEEDAVWMDFEHPLVDKTLVFEVEIVAVEPPGEA